MTSGGSKPRRGAPEREGKVPSVNARTFALLCGVHHNTVGLWVRDGLPVTRSGARLSIDLAEGFQWVRARDQAAVEAARNRTDPEGARAAKLTAEARLRELDVEEREGTLVSADDVEARWTQMMVAVREAVLGIAGTAVQSGLIEPTREADLDKIARDALIAVGEAGSAEST